MLNINNALEKYIINHTTEEDTILNELNRETHIKVLQPRMLSGHIQGKVLEFLSRFKSPHQILEIGTYTGYSAICLARGLQPEGKLYTIEKNDELIWIASKYFKKSGLNNKIIPLIGEATKIIPTLHNNFELVFLDSDKNQYIELYKLIINKVVKNGLIIIDNVLWNGKVFDKKSIQDEDTNAIIEFNEFIQQDKQVDNIILPVRDGIMLCVKK